VVFDETVHGLHDEILSVVLESLEPGLDDFEVGVVHALVRIDLLLVELDHGLEVVDFLGLDIDDAPHDLDVLVHDEFTEFRRLAELREVLVDFFVGHCVFLFCMKLKIGVYRFIEIDVGHTTVSFKKR